MNKTVLLFSLFLTTSASAAIDPNTIYTWGYGPFMTEQLKSIAGIMGDLYAVKIAAAIGLLSLIFKKLFDERTSHVMELGKFFLLATFIWVGFMMSVPGHNKYNIKDLTNGYVAQVSGVPLVVGKSFAFFSSMEYLISEGMGKYYSTPTSVQYASAGLGFPLGTHTAISEIVPPSIHIQQTLDEYLDNCILYAIEDGMIDSMTLYDSDDILGAISVIDNSRVTKVYNASNLTGTIQTCTSAYTSLVTMMDNELVNMQTLIAGSLGISNKFTAVGNIVNNKASDVSKALFGIAKTSKEYILQSATINMLDKSFTNVARLNGIDSFSMAYGSAVAERQAQTNFIMSGKMAHKYLPILKGILTLLIVAISWLLALMALAYYEMKFLWMVFSLQIWMMLWTPIAVVMNHIMLLNVEAVLEPYSVIGSWYSMNNKGIVDGEILRSLAWMGYLGWMIPLLAYAISKGSDHAFTMLANNLSGAMGGATGQAAGEVSRGDIKLGNVRSGSKDYYDNGYHHNVGAQGSTESGVVSMNGNNYSNSVTSNPQTGTVNRTVSNPNGKSTVFSDDGSVVATNNFNATTGQSYQSSLNSTISNAKQTAHEANTGMSNIVSAARQQIYGASSTAGTTEQNQSSVAQKKMMATSDAEGISKLFNENESFKEDFTKSFSASVGANGQLNKKGLADMLASGVMKIIPGAKGGFSIADSDNHSVSVGKSDTETFNRTVSSSISDEISKNSSLSEGFNQQVQSSDNYSGSNAFSELTSFNTKLSESESSIKTAQKALSNSTNWNADKSASALEYVRQHWNDGEPVTDADGNTKKEKGANLTPVELVDKLTRYESGKLNNSDKDKMEKLFTQSLNDNTQEKDLNKIEMPSANHVNNPDLESLDVKDIVNQGMNNQENGLNGYKEQANNSVAKPESFGNSVNQNYKQNDNKFQKMQSTSDLYKDPRAHQSEAKFNEEKDGSNFTENALMAGAALASLASPIANLFGDKPDSGPSKEALSRENAKKAGEEYHKAISNPEKYAKDNFKEMIENDLKENPIGNQADAKREILNNVNSKNGSVTLDDMKNAGYDDKKLDDFKNSGFSFNESKSSGFDGSPRSSHTLDFKSSGNAMAQNELESYQRHSVDAETEKMKTKHPDIDPDGKKGFWNKLGNELTDAGKEIMSPKNIAKGGGAAILTGVAEYYLSQSESPYAQAAYQPIAAVGDTVNQGFNGVADAGIYMYALASDNKELAEASLSMMQEGSNNFFDNIDERVEKFKGAVSGINDDIFGKNDNAVSVNLGSRQ